MLNVNVLMYSQFGLKKTRTALLKFPKPMAVFDLEGGLLSLRKEMKQVGELSNGFLKYELTTSQGYSGLVIAKSYPTAAKNSYFDLITDIQYIKAMHKELKSVALDSASELARLIQTYTAQLPLSAKMAAGLEEDEEKEISLGMSRVPMLNDWGGIVERCRQILRQFRDFKNYGLYTIATALEQTDYKENPGGEPIPVNGLPNLPGKIRSEMPALFDECWHLTSQVVMDGQEKLNKVIVMTQPHGIWYAKSRLGVPRSFDVDQVDNIIKSLDQQGS